VKLALRIAYDGSGSAGFQRQTREVTVQGTLEGVLSQILGQQITLQGAGRTDAGVHATGQVVCCSLERPPDLGRLCHSVNAIVRGPLAVLEAALLDAGDPFHPRYSALSRTYSYFLLDGCGPGEARLWSGRAWCLPCRLDLDTACQAAEIFRGEHDFSTFSYRMQDMESCVRRVLAVDLGAEPAPPLLAPRPGPRLLRLSITANGFLRRMVRLLAAAIVEAGLGLRSPQEIRARLQSVDASQAPHPGPCAGLYLERISYHPDPFESQRGTSRHAIARLQSQHRLKG
jgi:tRNA pseudouridine38-40 synthase